MKNETRERAFNEQVAVRLKSSDWDLQIARNVLTRRRRRMNYIFAAASSAASLAMAASLIFAVLPGMLDGASEGARLNQFVNAQVEGTWQKVFAESETQYDTGTDALIDETLAQRL
jgi:hypothetical protein